MSSSPEPIKVKCPSCGLVYESWVRRHISLEESWTPDELRRASSARCLECGYEVHMSDLAADDKGVYLWKGASLR